MYLARLEIYGFKTFAQKVDLRFDDGITNIVGPNGCGKSNVVDALRWSLGEQKMSVLRSEKLENVIFNGTTSRKPLNVAEVSVTVHNTKNILPVEYTEVKITRRIYRSGESEYYLNNMPCRLKDINDLLMDTGMGADAYSVIELKMVEQILSDNTEDRRRMFEEAAGITKYKQRRKQTLRKLDETRTDLTRVNDIIAEIEKNVNSLKRQTQKAKRYQKLSAQLKYEEVRLAHHDFARISGLMKPLEERLAGLEDEAERQLGEIAKKEAEHEELNRLLIGKEQELREIQIRMNALSEEIETIEKEMLVSRERKKNLEDLIRRYSEEKANLENRKTHWRERIGELRKQNDAVQDELQALKEDHERKKQEQQDTERELAGEKNALESVRKQLVGLIDEMAKSRNQFQLAKNNIQNVERKINELRSDMESHRETTGDTQSVIDERQYQQRKDMQEVELYRQQTVQIAADIDEHKSEIERVRSEKLQIEADIRSHDAQIGIIRKAMESHAGFPESVQYLLNDAQSPIRSTVADGLSTDEIYKKAVEAAISESYAFLLSGSEDSILEAIGRLSSSEHGHASFLNVSQIPKEQASARSVDWKSASEKVLGPAVDLIRSDAPGLTEWLLGDVVLTENFDQARKLAAQYPKFRFVTLQGEIAQGRHFFKAGSRRKSGASLIGQNETLKRLQEQYQRLVGELAGRESELNALAAKSAELETLHKTAKESLRTAEIRLNDLDKEISQSRYEHKLAAELAEKNQESIRSASEELARFQELVAEMEPQLREQEDRRTALELENRRLELRVAELEKQFRTRTDAFNQTSAKLFALDNDYRNALSQIAGLEQQTAEADETIARHDHESEQAALEGQQAGESDLEKEKQLITLSKQKDRQEKERDFAEQAVSQQREMNLKVESELKKLRRQREDGLSSRHKLEQQVGDYRYETRSLHERIMREYEFDLTRDCVDSLIPDADHKEEEEPNETADAADANSAPETAPPSEEKNLDDVLSEDLPDEELADGQYSPEEAKNLIAELRRKIKMLGMVNMEAFAEYTKEKERLDILVKQREDLLEAEKQLMETIATINATAQKQFMETFEQIRANFIKIFTSLFDESEANLELAKDEDPLEAGIEIFARPTGKKVQHISLLSGGEKTLTAIALLFAIYLVKPSPFCVLDEVDAPLDDANIDKFTKILRDFSNDTQFIVVTHNKRTMETASNIFGITMQEKGVSKVVAVKFKDRDSSSDDIVDIIEKNKVADLTQDIKEPPSTPSQSAK